MSKIGITREDKNITLILFERNLSFATRDDALHRMDLLITQSSNEYFCPLKILL